MLKSFSFGKNQGGVLITLLVIIALGACYFFLYLPKNERTVQERRFRCLRKIDFSLRDKIQTSLVQITNLANDYNKYSDDKHADELRKLRKYIAGYSTKNFTLLLPEQAIRYFNKDHDKLTYMGDDDQGNKRYIDVGSQFTLLVKKDKNNSTLKSKTNKTNTDDTVIGMRYEFTQFVNSILLSDVFDHYIIFINNKKIYEDYPSGLNITNPDSLLSVKNRITTPGVRSLQVGETDYKVFSHPVYTFSGSIWTITGLLRNDNYQAEKNQLPLWLLLLLTTAAIVMLVSLPWIKLYHMGNKDRLTLGDGIASILVAMVLMSLLFFAFFKYRVDLKNDRIHYRAGKTKSENFFSKDDYSRNVLAEKITTAFTGEINMANNLLDSFKAYHNKGDSDVYLLGKGKGKYDALFKKYSHNLDVKQVLWLDPSGSEKTNLTVDSTNDPKAHYNNRNYFSKAGNFKMDNHPFYLDQIFSYTDGTFRSVISQKIKKDSVIAMSFNMKSLTNITMPDGYQFAIISGGGWVCYHSKPARNLIEDLRQEVDSKDLLSAIKAKSDTSFKAEYYGKLYNIKIKPIPGLPYFTVIFEDVGYNDMRDTEAYTFTLSMLMGMLIFLIIKYSVVFFVSSSRSFFKRQHFDTSWLGPHKSSHHQYNIAIIANSLIILVLVLLFNHSSFFQYLHMLLVSIVFTSLFLCFIFAKKYWKDDRCKYKFKLTAAIWLGVLLVLIDITAWFNLASTHKLILYEVIMIALSPVILWSAGLLLKMAREFKVNHLFTWTFTHSYALMVTTRLIITSGIPVAFFFIYSFDYEQSLDTRYRQLNFANALISKESFIKDKNVQAINKKLDSLKNNLPYTSGIYSDGLFINDIQVDANKTIIDTIKYISAFNGEDLLTAELLNAFRLNTNDIEVQNAYLNLPSSDDFVFSKLNKRSGDKSPVRLFYKIDTGKYLKISSLPGINYQTPHLLFWILLIVAIIVFYFIIHLVIRKVFALDLHYNKEWGKMDSELLENNKFNSKVLIVGSPGSNTLQKLIYKINAKKITSDDGQPLSIDDVNLSKTNAFLADMMLISTENGESDPDWKRHKTAALAGNGLVIINHFEYNIWDARVNKIKLDLLESLIAQNISKVIIISTVHPLIFLDSFSSAQHDQVSETERERWDVLLGNFHVVIDSLVASDIQENTQMPIKAIKEETRYSRFLHRMQLNSLKSLNKQISAIPSNVKTQGWITESLIFKIQVTSQYFYTDIWQSLTLEEKFLLNDLAEDGLVNSFDEFNLSLLMCKGLIVDRDGALVLFNRGFRNFILTAIGKKEVARIKEQLKDNGRWGNLKAPLTLAIFAILVFLFASQQEEYSQVITYITAFTAGIPAVLKVFSMFGSNSNQKTA